MFVIITGGIGGIIALFLRDELQKRGYTVFFDQDNMEQGRFDEQTRKHIEDCTDFLLVLSLDRLDRCINEDDWLRREIVCAELNDKNNVLIIFDGLVFPDNLPYEIEVIKNFPKYTYQKTNALIIFIMAKQSLNRFFV